MSSTLYSKDRANDLSRLGREIHHVTREQDKSKGRMNFGSPEKINGHVSGLTNTLRFGHRSTTQKQQSVFNSTMPSELPPMLEDYF